MAIKIVMKNPTTGIMKTGFYGYSWTMLLFGIFPPFFRGDFKTGLILLLLSFLTFGFAPFIWSFFYNKHYTRSLVSQGFRFASSDGENILAKQKLGIA